MDNLSSVTVMLVGMCGALAPETLRLYALRTTPEEFQWSGKYVALSLPFVLLGGLVAVVLPAVTLWGAFYAGLSTPFVITSALNRTPKSSAAPAGGERPAALGRSRPTTFRQFLSALR